MSDTNESTINGVPEDRWGTWCEHGIRIVEPAPREVEQQYPMGQIVDPWPCNQGCTREGFIQEMKDEAASYEAAQWDEYRSMVGG